VTIRVHILMDKQGRRGVVFSDVPNAALAKFRAEVAVVGIKGNMIPPIQILSTSPLQTHLPIDGLGLQTMCLYPAPAGTSIDGVAGQVIVSVRPMTLEELDAEGWQGRHGGTALVLGDGTIIYPSADAEGNGPGEFFMRGPDGKAYLLSAGETLDEMSR
jgi:hypothetical protein